MGLLDKSFGALGYSKSGQPAPTQEKAVQKAADMTTGASSWAQIFGGTGTSPRFSSFNHSLEQLQAYTDWVFAASHKIAEEVASIDLKLFINNTPMKNAILGNKFITDKKTIQKYLSEPRTILETKDGRVIKRKLNALEEVEDHPLLQLLNCPNPFMTKDEFFEMTVLHLELSGDAFWAINRDEDGQPSELWPLMPNLVSVIPDKEKFIIGYIYTVNGQQVPFGPDDIIHHKYANPMDFRRGMSTVAAAARAIDTDAHAADYNRKFFYNSAQPDAILYTDSEIDEKVYKRIQSEWADTYKGAANAHRTAILENGLKYQQISINQRDMDFLAGRNFNRDQILAMFGVPKSIIGLDDVISRANAETADYVFTKGKIRPKMLKLVNRINQDLAIQFDQKLIVSFTDPVPDDKDFELKQERQLVNVTHTVNEFRAARGLEPVSGGDELYIASNMIPIAQLSIANQEQELKEDEEKDDNLPSEGEDDDIDKPEGNAAPGTGTSAETGASENSNGSSNSGKSITTTRPIHDEITEKDSKIAKKLDEKYKEKLETPQKASKKADSTKKKDENTKLEVLKDKSGQPLAYIKDLSAETKAKADDFLAIRDRITDQFEGDFLKAARNRFVEQKTEVIANINSRFKTYSGSKVKGKLPKQLKAQLDDLFNPDLSVEAWAKAFDSIYHSLNAEMGTAAMDFVNNDGTDTYDANTPIFTDWLAQRTQKIAGSIDEETTKQLRAALMQDISEGKSVTDMINTVENIYGASAGYRAERIARTEAIDASTFSTVEAWKQTGVVEGKKWYTAGNPCDRCEAMAEETTAINDNFLNMGDTLQYIDGTGAAATYDITYSDVIGPPLHPNCRCTLLPVISMGGSPLD